MESTEGNTVGQLLREAREKRGVDLSAAHAATRISPQVLRALEEDDHSSFESETYLKGFLRSYATWLGLDHNMLWDTMRRRGGAAEAAGTFWDIEETVREERLRSPRIFRRVVLPLMVLLILVLALLLLRANQRVRQLTTGSVTPSAEHGVHANDRSI